MKDNKIFDFSRKGFQDIINIMTRKINECVDISNELFPRLDNYISKINWDKIVNSDLYQNVLDELGKTNVQMENNTKYINVKKEKTGLLKIRELIKNSLKYNDKLTYIIVGDSTRESRGAIIYNYMKEKLLQYNIDVKMVAKSGLKAEHWSKTTIDLQPGYPTVDEVIKLINDEGNSVIVDICLGINDIDYKTVQEVKQFITNGINLIKESKPNTNFILTSPNTRANENSNVKTRQVYDELVNENNYAFINVLDNVFKSYEQANSEGYMDDTTHPNMDGQRKMFNYIINSLIDSETLLTANKQYPIFKNKITLQGVNGECNIYGVLQLVSGSIVNLKLKNTKGTWYIYNGDETNSCTTGFTKNGLHFLDIGYSANTSVKGYIYIDNLTVLTETYDVSLNSFVADNITFSQINYLDINNEIRMLKGEPDETHFNYNVFKDVGMRLEVIGHTGDIYIKKIGNQIRLVPDGAGFDYIGNNISCIQKGYSYFEDNTKGVKAWLYVANPNILNSIGNNYYCKFKNFSVNEFTKQKRISDVLLGL